MHPLLLMKLGLIDQRALVQYVVAVVAAWHLRRRRVRGSRAWATALLVRALLVLAEPKQMQQNGRQLANTGQWLGHLPSASLQVAARLLHHTPAQSGAMRQLHALHWSVQQQRQGLSLPSLLAPASLELQQHIRGEHTMRLEVGLPQACVWPGGAQCSSPVAPLGRPLCRRRSHAGRTLNGPGHSCRAVHQTGLLSPSRV